MHHLELFTVSLVGVLDLAGGPSPVVTVTFSFLVDPCNHRNPRRVMFLVQLFVEGSSVERRSHVEDEEC